MKYLSIDIETTGLDAEKCQILEFCGIVEDSKVDVPVEKLPRFHVYFDHRIMYGEIKALAMNSALIVKLSLMPPTEKVLQTSFFGELVVFLKDYFLIGEKIVLAGKNPNFDRGFLRKTNGWNESLFHHRMLDPVTLYTDWSFDNVPPSTEQVLERAGISSAGIHTAEVDAQNVITMLRIARKLRV